MLLLCKKLSPWKLIATLAVIGMVIAACGGGGSEEASSPTAVPAKPTPTAPAFNINPTNTPVASPTAQAIPTVTLIPAVTVESETGNATGKIAVDGDAIAVHYTGTLDNGDVFDTSLDGDPPLEFVLGGGQMIPGFEEAVKGMAVGEMKTVRLSPDEAYGEREDDLIVELPKEGAPDGLKVGDSVRLSNGMPVTIIEISEEVVVIDANHRLAGQALTFEIEIISIN